MKYFSMFSGIGGFELGIQQAYEDNIQAKQPKKERRMENMGKYLPNDISKPSTNPLCIGYSENDKYAIQIYEKHFKHKNYGDCTKINPATLPDFDLLVGGFPCQAFSIAGKRKGFDDTRGTLFFDIARILKEKRPERLLLENVKGLLSHDTGRTFKTILSTLTGLGYDLQTMVLNSKNFGVPQNRERVFIAGCLGGWGGKQVFSFGENEKLYNRKNPAKQRQSQTQTSGTVRSNPSKADGTYITSVSPMEFRWTKNSGALRARDYKDPKVVADGMQIRRLTPTECERLQSFPDGWTAKGIDEEGNEVDISDTQRYKTLGNAITTSVVKEIVLRLLYE